MNKKIVLSLIFVIILSLIYLFPRLYQFEQNINFRYDQGLHLLETYEMVKSGQIRFVGPAVTSKTFEGRQFFIGPNYYYFLAILGVIFSWSVSKIILSLIFIELFFYLLFFYFIKKYFGFLPALITFVGISCSPYLIYHSSFFWNPHFLIPLSILLLIFSKNIFISSFLFGLAFSFHYSAIFWIIPIILIFKINQKINLKNILIAISMFLLANLPFYLFEIKNSFYNFKTMLLIFLNSKDSGSLTSHYFIFPLIIFVIFIFLYLSQKYKKPFYLIPFLFLIFFKNTNPLDNFWIYPDQVKTAQIILQKQCLDNYNIAATIQGDTRFYDLRYLLTINNCPPDKVENYPHNKYLYLISNKDNPHQETVWEVDSFKPFQIQDKIKINQNINLFLIQRIDK